MTWTTDNRWSPGASGFAVPDDAPAAYAARWIDMGDEVLPDILGDRQGFAWTNDSDRGTLIERLTAEDLRATVRGLYLDRRDGAAGITTHPTLCWGVRRAGGYFYVEAWLP